jgi:neurofibromin 1
MRSNTKLILSLINRVAVRVSLSHNKNQKDKIDDSPYFFQLPINSGRKIESLEHDPIVQQTGKAFGGNGFPFTDIYQM